MKMFRLSRISIKLFFITAVIFSVLLIAALYAQSYYYKNTYIINKVQDGGSVNYSNLTKDLTGIGADPEKIAETLEEYRLRNNMEAIIFDKTGKLKYDFTALSGYKPTQMLSEAINIFNEEMFPTSSDNYAKGLIVHGNGLYVFSDGEHYIVLPSNYLKNGDILLAVTPIELFEATPGILDNYFVYIPIISVIVCMFLSFLFSQIVSRPLVKINAAAGRMAELDFATTLKSNSNDELGQLSLNINSLAKKLDHTLSDLVYANKKLQADIDMEKKLEASRKEFIANASHELKTPIAAIKGYSAALQDGIMENKREHYINQIAAQADRMDKLVRDMLDLSNIESASYAIKPEEFNICALAKDALEQCVMRANKKSLELTFSSDYSTLPIYADRLKIGQVIVNFIDNALNHTPANGKIIVSVRRVTDEKAKVSVINEGSTIPDDNLRKVWERFFTGEQGHNKTKGTGLGLAISAKILELHNMPYGAKNITNGVEFYFLIL